MTTITSMKVNVGATWMEMTPEKNYQPSARQRTLPREAGTQAVRDLLTRRHPHYQIKYQAPKPTTDK